MDVCRVQEDCAWVIDGCDPLFPTHISDCSSDGEWLVRELNLYLKKNLHLPYQSISDIVYRGIQAIHREYCKYPQAKDLCDLEMPSACCAIVRVRHEQLSYFVMGNCEVVLTFTDGSTKHICDLRLQEMDAKLLEISQDLRKKQRMPLFRARNFMDHLLVENRLRRNVQDGYFVIGEDQEAVRYALSGAYALRDIRSISLICNGFSQYFNCTKVTQNLDRYIKEKRSVEFVELYDRMLSKKAANPQLARYIQEKMAGPSTVVCFDCQVPKKLASQQTGNRHP